MQTREPRKRVNWIFVLVLIIVIPLAIFTIFMMNTAPNPPRNTSSYDSTITGAATPDSLTPDTTQSPATKDTTLGNN